MRNPLELLKRIQEQKKRQARLSYAKAERTVAAQHQRLVDVEEALGSAHDLDEQIRDDPDEALWLAQSHAHRLRLEMRRRQESRSLLASQQEAEARRDDLISESREDELYQRLLESQQEQAQVEARRAESHAMDEAAAIRWWSTEGAK